LMLSSLDSSVFVASNSTFRTLLIISKNDCFVNALLDSFTTDWENTIWNIRLIFLDNVIVSFSNSMKYVEIFCSSTDCAACLFVVELSDLQKFSKDENFETTVWTDFEFSMKFNIDLDRVEFEVECFKIEKIRFASRLNDSYDRDLKSKLMKNRAFEFVSKSEKTDVNDEEVNDRILNFSFEIRSTMSS
jgi:hypothetical protein